MKRNKCWLCLSFYTGSMNWIHYNGIEVAVCNKCRKKHSKDK